MARKTGSAFFVKWLSASQAAEKVRKPRREKLLALYDQAEAFFDLSSA
jgi:hypothetical protein